MPNCISIQMIEFQPIALASEVDCSFTHNEIYY